MRKKIGKFQIDQIYCGDALELMKDIPSESIDLIVTDPPFAIDFKAKRNNYNRDQKRVLEGYNEIPKEKYFEFTVKWMEEAYRILKKTGSMYVFSGWTNLKDILNAIDKIGFITINHLIWKYQFGVFTKRKYVTSHYHILFAVKNKRNYFFNKIEHYPEDVWNIKRVYHTGLKKNATKLPTDVVLRCIDFGSKPGDIILDPFMGNGTTAVACKGAYRHYIGYEINKQMQEIIEWNLNKIKLGEFYTPYSERTDDKR